MKNPGCMVQSRPLDRSIGLDDVDGGRRGSRPLLPREMVRELLELGDCCRPHQKLADGLENGVTVTGDHRLLFIIEIERHLRTVKGDVGSKKRDIEGAVFGAHHDSVLLALVYRDSRL